MGKAVEGATAAGIIAGGKVSNLLVKK